MSGYPQQYNTGGGYPSQQYPPPVQQQYPQYPPQQFPQQQQSLYPQAVPGVPAYAAPPPVQEPPPPYSYSNPQRPVYPQQGAHPGHAGNGLNIPPPPPGCAPNIAQTMQGYQAQGPIIQNPPGSDDSLGGNVCWGL